MAFIFSNPDHDPIFNFSLLLTLTAAFTIAVVQLVLKITLTDTDNYKQKKKEKLRRALEQSILSEKLQNEDLRHLLGLYGLTERDLVNVLRELLAEGLAGSSQSGNIEPAEIRRFLDWYAQEHPFSQLPENIRIQLETLKHELPNASSRLRDLATSLTELYQKNQAEVKKQTRLAWVSLWFGILGVLLALVFGFLSLPAFQKSNHQSESVVVAPTNSTAQH